MALTPLMARAGLIRVKEGLAGERKGTKAASLGGERGGGDGRERQMEVAARSG
jgi:hypothetical protein